MFHKHIVTLLLAMLVSHSLLGFRALNKEPSRIMNEADETFSVDSHIELYTMVRVEADGSVYTDRWLLAYEYRGEETRGIWRILPDEDQSPVTLLSIQAPGTSPKMWLKEGDQNAVKEVRGIDRRRAFGPSDWNLEDIYDDDKNDWRHRRLGNATVRGEDAMVLESRYGDPELKESSRYDSRRVYLSLQDRKFLKSNFYDAAGDLIKSVYAEHHMNVGGEQNPVLRARRLEILDHVDGSISILVQISANFDLDLPPELFSVESLKGWDSTKDNEMLIMLEPLNP